MCIRSVNFNKCSVFFSGNHMFLSLQEFMADSFYTPAFENYAAPWRNIIGNRCGITDITNAWPCATNFLSS